MGCWAALARCWGGFRFADAQQEAHFRHHRKQESARLCFWWCLVSGVLLLADSLLMPFQSPRRRPLVFLLPMALTAALLLAAAAGLRGSKTCRANTPHLTVVAGLAVVAVCGWVIPALVQADTKDTLDGLREVFQVLEGNSTAVLALEQYVKKVTTAQDLWPTLVYLHLFLSVATLFAYSRLVHAVYFALPTALLLCAVFSEQVVLKNPVPIVTSFVIASYCSAITMYVLVLRRREFGTEYARQQSLAKEARAIQELARREMQHRESAQEADSILNHSLKNMMADAAGCIHMYAATLPGPLPADLALALACLDRGMGWCRKRQALLRLTDGGYAPMLTPVPLRELGESMVRGRCVACSFPSSTALLDRVLFDLVLDNGINNAFQHGHPTSPNVHFTITMTPCGGGRHLLTFEVMNRAYPDRPMVSPQLMDCVARSGADHVVDGPEHLGLQHMYLAARAHGMTLVLEQHGEWVTLKGRLEVLAAPPDPTERALPPQLEAAPLPPETRIYCVDDSAIARRLLTHTFSLLPSRPLVRTFGETAEEVEAFLSEATEGADIVILDQYLDYGPVRYLGTNLLQQLLTRGFTGLGCIRSANVSPDNQRTYLEAGVHCTIGKDLGPRELVSTVQQAFAQHGGPLRCTEFSTVRLRSNPSPAFADISHLCTILPGTISDDPNKGARSSSSYDLMQL